MQLVECQLKDSVAHVRWRTAPCEAGMRELVGMLAPAPGRVVVVQTYAHVLRPTPQEMEAWKAQRGALEQRVLHVHAIVDAPGVSGSVLRSSMNCTLLLHGLLGFISVHPSIDCALYAIAQKHAMPKPELAQVRSLIRQAVQRTSPHVRLA